MDAAFTVESVNERQTIDAAGQLVNVTVMHLKTMRGARGSIELPTEQFLALTAGDEGKAVLKGMLQERANSLEVPFGM